VLPLDAAGGGVERVEAAVEDREVDAPVGERRRELEQRTAVEHPALPERRPQPARDVAQARVVEAVGRPGQRGRARRGRRGGGRRELGRGRADDRVGAAAERARAEDEGDEHQAGEHGRGGELPAHPFTDT
jgi:hypothetical protein